MTMAKQDLKGTMKQGLGGSITSQSSIFDVTVPAISSKVQTKQQPVIEDEKQPWIDSKGRTERLTLVLSTDQKDLVETFVKAIQRNGVKKSERVNFNSVVRCLVDLLEDFSGDVSQIANEENLKEAFKRHFKHK